MMSNEVACACKPRLRSKLAAEVTKKLKYLKNARMPRFVISDTSNQYLGCRDPCNFLTPRTTNPISAMPIVTGAASHQSRDFENARDAIVTATRNAALFSTSTGRTGLPAEPKAAM